MEVKEDEKKEKNEKGRTSRWMNGWKIRNKGEKRKENAGKVGG